MISFQFGIVLLIGVVYSLNCWNTSTPEHHVEQDHPIMGSSGRNALLPGVHKDLSEDQIALWKSERTRPENALADRVFRSRPKGMSWEDAKIAVELVSKFAIVITTNDLYVTEYELDETEEYARPLVVSFKQGDSADDEIIRDFCDADLDADELYEEGVRCISAARAMSSMTPDQEYKYAEATSQHCKVERREEALENKVHTTMAGSGWL
jgi:hypothetical protein